jgi:hypothetical protein
MRRLLWAVPLSFLVVGCLAADPGVEGLTRGEFKEGGATGFDGGTQGDGGDAGAPDGAAEAAVDSGTTTTAFSGAGTYTATQPNTTAVQYHQNNGVGVTPGKNQDCLGCHKMGGSGKVFLFAGTVFQDQNGNTPAASEEVRVRGNDGKGFSAHSDSDGNFWYEPGTGESIAFNAQTGVRDGTNTVLMTGAISKASCNASGCHDGSTQAYLHIP